MGSHRVVLLSFATKKLSPQSVLFVLRLFPGLCAQSWRRFFFFFFLGLHSEHSSDLPFFNRFFFFLIVRLIVF